MPQSVRLPWLGYTLRRHDYTHTNADTPGQQRILRDICRWHVEEFAYLIGKLKSAPEGDGMLFDHCCLLYVHEHAEANPRKNNGLAAIVAGHAGKSVTGRHTKVRETCSSPWQRIPCRPGLATFPTAEQKLPGILG